MSADNTSTLNGVHGLLRGQRTRSYGSLVSSSYSPVRQRRIKHKVHPGETLQGISVKYGVSMEQIKRANRLYTNDSIFLKECLLIPVMAESVSFTKGVGLTEEETNPAQANIVSEKTSDARSDLSPGDYLKKMDGLISQTKQAAVKTCKDGEKQFSSMEQIHCNNDSTIRPKQEGLRAVPVTVIKQSRCLRDREDEIFQL